MQISFSLITFCFKPANKLDYPNLHHTQFFLERNKSHLALIGGTCPRFLQNLKFMESSFCSKKEPQWRLVLKTFNILANSCICQYPQATFSLHFLHPFFLSLSLESLSLSDSDSSRQIQTDWVLSPFDHDRCSLKFEIWSIAKSRADSNPGLGGCPCTNELC